MRIPVAPQPPSAFGVVSVLNFGHCNRWYLTVVFIFIFLITYVVEHLFISLFDICVYFFGEVSVKVFDQFLNWVIF